MASGSHPDTWYCSPVYARYWQHYQQAMSWLHRHRQAYSKALEAAWGPVAWPRGSSDWHVGAAGNSGSEEEEEETSDGSSSGVECDVTRMDITDELREYFAQTERHREELKRQQQEDAERHGTYVLADQDPRSAPRFSAAPPMERPGERRSAEMKKLYGKDAPRIQAMEAAMQLTFDRNCDRKQPKYWPVIPLRL
ncbi:gem-associated protein 8 [Denticeps clupeoides]|uniref:gem-associated protein 8 n=1 Tax=Denticeps clupeoides TaxID=299321 RepID=UPI0010A51EBA|nr:gem-associated protein 8-like [Denticeps clupeoides]